MTLDQYVAKINTLYQTGNAREHSYRGDLQNLLMAILPDVLVTNEPARVACGAPDYVLTRKDVPLGYIEAKDIGVDLKSKSLKEQFDRYRNGLSNLIFTDYLDFHFYRDGAFVTSISIGRISSGTTPPVGHPSRGGEYIEGISENYEQFIRLIEDFAQTISQTIKSPTKLAQMMAGKARLMADVIEKTLNNDDEVHNVSALKGQMLTFKQMLIHDIDNKSFSDIYSQTIAYGMFAARYHDPSLPTFSRQEAASLIPRSNPFLRKLFQDIAGYDLDSRLVWIVDDLVSIFLASDVATIMKNFGKSTKQEDPVVHFYETFLGEYNPALRKARGVWYTPQPVVNFIVRAVDDVLKTEFGLKDGLADTSKTKIKVKVTKFDDRSKGKSIIIGEQEIEKEVHRVQVLDPATGTGTFLAEVVKHIYKKFEGQQGIWSNYVKNDLIPRLNGFELLMASYAMAHLKMDMLLTETGYTQTTPPDGHPSKGGEFPRLKIFLTNSLEEATDQQMDLFNWLAEEANQANAVKKEAPVMVVIGNPPYSVSSSNKSEWIEGLTADYKKDLNERNIQPLSDDYIKFIRFGQHFIDKNGSGILAYISNNSFIDGIIHRQMRKHLLESFDKIYILDLHGNSKKKEVCPDGSPDQNVFDIMQGVSINILVKTGKKDKYVLGQLLNYDLFGKREFKYDYLKDNSLKSIKWKKLDYFKPNYFFVEKNFEGNDEYAKGFKIDEIFNVSNTGIETGRDDFFIDWDKTSLAEKIKNVLNNKYDSNVLSKYKITDTSSFRFKEKIIKSEFEESKISNILYRPFDNRFTYYDINLQRRASFNTIRHLVKDNYAITTCRQQSTFDFQHVLISNCITERCTVSLQTKETGYVFPLYLYPDSTGQQNAFEEGQARVPNLNMDMVKTFADGLGLVFVAEKPTPPVGHPSGGGKPTPPDGHPSGGGEIAPIDILDYIYAVLHSPNYREKYKEFLKIDFPRVPYPSSPQPSPKEREQARKRFWALVELGMELRQLHLLESDTVEKYITKYPIDGDNVVSKPKFELSECDASLRQHDKTGRVYINESQYFDGVPEVAWNFYIGGYQPAQKWLKDRKDRTLTYEDIFHYQKMIVALSETERIMGEVDENME